MKKNQKDSDNFRHIKALLLVIPTRLEMFQQDLYRIALILVIPTVVEIFNKVCTHHTKAALQPSWSQFTVVEIR